MFLSDQRVLVSVRRVWHWMTICVATEFSADESPEQIGRSSRTTAPLLQTRARR
jgi:hypothetical protein